MATMAPSRLEHFIRFGTDAGEFLYFLFAFTALADVLSSK